MTVKERAPGINQGTIRVKVNLVFKLFFIFLGTLLTKKKPCEPEPEPKRIFGSNGLPRIKPKQKLCMPEYERDTGCFLPKEDKK